MSKTKISVIVGVVLALLIVASGVIVVPRFLNASQKSTRPNITYHRSAELAQPDHSAQSTVAVQSQTANNPWGITIDEQHGLVWVAEPGCDPTPVCQSAFPSIIGEYSQADGSLIENFKEPDSTYSSPLFVTLDNQGDVWFTEPTTDHIGELIPSTNIWHQWPLPKGTMPYDLLFDKNGNLWFTEFGSSAIGFFNPRTQLYVQTLLPTANSNPYGITMDIHGNIWFTENALNVEKIGTFTPTTTGKIQITEYVVPFKQPHLITSDKNGNIWFSGAFEGTIGKFDPATGVTQTYLVSLFCKQITTGICETHISGIVIDPHGNVWFTDSLGGRVGYLVPSSGQVFEAILSKHDAHPHDGLAIDNYGTIWFTEEFNFQLDMWPADTWQTQTAPAK
jgi:streptogramin lyase